MKHLGKLLWIAKLRPELDYVINLLCRAATLTILLKTNYLFITAYCEANFAKDDDSKSRVVHYFSFTQLSCTLQWYSETCDDIDGR